METAPLDPLVLVQWGVLGVVLLMLLTGMLWAKPAVEQMKETQEKERKLWEERVIPTMERLSRNLEQNNLLLAEIIRKADKP